MADLCQDIINLITVWNLEPVLLSAINFVIKIWHYLRTILGQICLVNTYLLKYASCNMNFEQFLLNLVNVH